MEPDAGNADGAGEPGHRRSWRNGGRARRNQGICGEAESAIWRKVVLAWSSMVRVRHSANTKPGFNRRLNFNRLPIERIGPVFPLLDSVHHHVVKSGAQSLSYANSTY